MQNKHTRVFPLYFISSPKNSFFISKRKNYGRIEEKEEKRGRRLFLLNFFEENQRKERRRGNPEENTEE